MKNLDNVIRKVNLASLFLFLTCVSGYAVKGQVTQCVNDNCKIKCQTSNGDYDFDSSECQLCLKSCMSGGAQDSGEMMMPQPVIVGSDPKTWSPYAADGSLINRSGVAVDKSDLPEKVNSRPVMPMQKIEEDSENRDPNVNSNPNKRKVETSREDFGTSKKKLLENPTGSIPSAPPNSPVIKPQLETPAPPNSPAMKPQLETPAPPNSPALNASITPTPQNTPALKAEVGKNAGKELSDFKLDGDQIDPPIAGRAPNPSAFNDTPNRPSSGATPSTETVAKTNAKDQPKGKVASNIERQ